MTTITRFAPSPSGNLHLGGARTALFNFLYAKSKNGKFKIRIEDTDKDRIENQSIDSIINGLEWLGIENDGNIVYQKDNIRDHKEFVNYLLDNKLAYKCFADQEEINNFKNLNQKFISKWRNTDKSKYPKNKKYTIRLKIQENNKIKIFDLVQGEVVVETKEIDESVLVRSDGNPTFLLASAVDDINMKITDIIRGDDHLTNTFRQYHLFQYSNKKIPNFAHIPLILNEEGRKLSKRDNVSSILDLKEKGYLSEAIFNYLLRLGWSFKNKELFSMEESKKVFTLAGVGKSPAKLDYKKINFLNIHYLKNLPKDKIFALYLKQTLVNNIELNPNQKKKIYKYFEEFIDRSINVNDLFENTKFLFESVLIYDEKHQQIIKNFEQKKLFIKMLEKIKTWDNDTLSNSIDNFIKNYGLKFKDIGLPIRLILTGSLSTPSIYILLEILGKKEVLKRLNDI